VKATVVATTNYNAGEATSTFTIAKADMSMVSVSYEDLVYNGSAQQLFTVNNVPENATVKYICQKITDPNQMICDPNDNMFTTTVPSATNAGYYGIIYKIEETNNYNGTEASQTYCVQIDAATITEVTLDVTSLSYNGADQTVTITSVEAGDLVLGANDYTVTLDGVAVTGNITAKYVGVYVVAVTGKGNFKGTESATFSIVNRTLADNEVEFHNNWATFFSEDGDVMLPAGIGAYVATEVGDGVVTVSQIKYIPGRIPVLLNNATETAGTVEFDVEMGVNLLQHASADIAASSIDGIVYGLYNGSMMRVSGTIPAGKNYLLVSSAMTNGPQAPQLTIVFEDNVTGISQIENDKSTNDSYYDLMGRKIQKPSKKGLYIQNGRVVFVDNK
jgi:archaellum component FlaF (FlaF/FlaG flagellin family)